MEFINDLKNFYLIGGWTILDLIPYGCLVALAWSGIAIEEFARFKGWA
jgi:hypothetical protein